MDSEQIAEARKAFFETYLKINGSNGPYPIKLHPFQERLIEEYKKTGGPVKLLIMKGRITMSGMVPFGNINAKNLKDVLAQGIMQFCAAKNCDRETELVVLTSSRVFDALLQELSPEEAKEATERALALKNLPAGLVLFDVPIMAIDDPRVKDKFNFFHRKGIERMVLEGM